MNKTSERSAIGYGRSLMAQVSGRDCGATAAPQSWGAWTGRLFTDEDLLQVQIYSVWSRVSMPGAKPANHSLVPLEPVSLGFYMHDNIPVWEMNPTQTASDYQSGVGRLIDAFLEHGGATTQDFDRFFVLMQKYASALPCTYGEDGVSLYRQWCMVVAVMALSSDGTPVGLPEALGLVGLDLPGIQEMVYTIASRGAGKSVRGRSAFVQLLVNALVDRLVHELGLCRANVLINAGGNALLLCRWTPELDKRINEFSRQVNELLFAGLNGSLFSGFAGDLSLAVACQQAPWEILAFPAHTIMDDREAVSSWQHYEKLLKQRLSAAKQQPFISLLNSPEQLKQFFTPDPIGSNHYCAVCRKPENPVTAPFAAAGDDEAQTDGAPPAVICPMCNSFRDLANDLAKNAQFLNCQHVDQPSADWAVWQVALHALSAGLLYSFVQTPASQGVNLALSPDDVLQNSVHGCWPMAHTTPMENGAVRDNQSLADTSPSNFKRLGILKADVDDLGAMLAGGLRDRRSAALTATMSESLLLFFGSWLDRICGEDRYKNKVYVLYAGGDDLLIVGAWDVMPLLAAHIARDFERFTGNNPAVHLSAGIHVVGGKEPLYAAIEGADAALKAAKQHTQQGRRAKRAIAVFGEIFSWEQFEQVSELEAQLKQMAAGGAASALLMIFQQLYIQYEDDLLPYDQSQSGYAVCGQFGRYQASGEEVVLGPWLWQMIYRLHRLANQNSKLKGEIDKLQTRLLQQDGVRQLAVSARWAQLLSREKA